MKLLLIRRKAVTVGLCLLAVVLMLYAVSNPAVAGATAVARQLPIYSVQREYKVVSLSFDAAWADVIMRRMAHSAAACHSAGGLV